MRKVSILSLWLAVFLMAVCFIGCSSGNSSNDSVDDNPAENTSSSLITYKGSYSSLNYTFAFTADNKFTLTSAYNSYAEEIEYKGTYTGDASKDGTVEITILEQRKDHNGNMEAYSGSQATQELAIANGNFTFEGTEYTRQ